ncbi:hypothetical protein [Rhodoplanes sp. SY1]|uniref:hypothetical protein n=1 Tax=Rhodoplanes sp. SY1 TaxID=3166646 RepID=UPI0038B58CE3
MTPDRRAVARFSSPRRSLLAAVLFGATVALGGPAGASEPSHGDGLDTEHIFGITMGSDIGEKGDFEMELETFSGIAKRYGTYFSTATHTHFKYTVTDNFRVAPGFTFGSHRIRGVEGLDNLSEANLHEASVEMRYKVLDRHKDPFGLTVNLEPGWAGVDPTSGRRTEAWGTVLSLLMDKEIVKDKLFGAVNVGWSGGTSRELGTRDWARDSEWAIHGALSYQFRPLTLIGIETRYLRSYGTLGLSDFKGEALYVGPTFHMMLSKTIGLSGTWNYQVAGKAVGDPRSLDLTNYEKNQILLRLTSHF